MATITSAQTGNFSSTSTWVGGVVPTSSDDAVAATGHVITIDTNVTVLSFQQAGTGKFVLGGGRTVTGNVIANAGTYTGGGTIEVTATTGTTATINGNVTGVSTTTQFIAAIVVTGVGALILNGSVTGSPGNAAGSQLNNLGCAGIYTNVACSITVNGAVTGATAVNKRGIVVDSNSGSAVVTIFGDVTTGATNSAGAIWCLGATNVLSITGNLLSLVGNSNYAVHMTGASAVLNITGNVTATVGDQATAVLVTGANAIVTVVGNAQGGTNNGVGISHTGASGTITMTGNATGGSTSNAQPGVAMSGTGSTLNFTGIATGNGPSNTSGFGISSSATTANTGVIFQGNMIDGTNGVVAVYTRLFRITATQAGYNQHQNTVGFPNGTPVFRVSPDQVTGMPAISNVRSGTIFGYSNQLTGTMAVPAPGSVSYGVPVDNTTGTASLRPEDIAALVGAQVAAGAKGVN